MSKSTIPIVIAHSYHPQGGGGGVQGVRGEGERCERGEGVRGVREGRMVRVRGGRWEKALVSDV